VRVGKTLVKWERVILGRNAMLGFSQRDLLLLMILLVLTYGTIDHVFPGGF